MGMKTVTYDDSKWRLVPEEPTAEMLEEIRLIPHFTQRALAVRYQAMLAAAPEYKGETK